MPRNLAYIFKLLWVCTVWFLAGEEYGIFSSCQGPWKGQGSIRGHVLALACGLSTQETECDF